MITREIATLPLSDQDSGNEAVAVIRTVNDSIVLCISLARGGDIEVVLSPNDCQRLVEALRQAMSPNVPIGR